VGSFEAKTHLSQLLDQVEKGAVVTITRRGKPVAVVRREESAAQAAALEAIHSLRALCAAKIPATDIVSLREEGRER
jgi:antitoxin (DNA-binding transcriptional repressor) of toxin-antitoxin stability system